MGIAIAHLNDGKEKFQSHEISILNIERDSNGEIDKLSYDTGLVFSDIYGYGENKEEALEDFKKKFLENFDKLEEFKNKLINNENIPTCEVDCLMNILKELED